MEAVGERENVAVMVMGKMRDTGRMVVKNSRTGETVLGELPKKPFVDHHVPVVLKPLVLPEQLTVMQALDRVLRLLSVGSKRFLTSKVDRSVTGLIARQQCCGPLHLPLSDVAVLAQSPFSTTAARRRWASQLEIVELECCEAMGNAMVEVGMAARTRWAWRRRWARRW